MRLESARELKIASLRFRERPSGEIFQLSNAADMEPEQASKRARLAIGISPRGKGDFALAVRIQDRALMGSKLVQNITDQARGEADVRYVGKITVCNGAPPGAAGLTLQAGMMVANLGVTPGTLGCFVTVNSGNSPYILSCNHVLNRDVFGPQWGPTIGDPIVQVEMVNGAPTANKIEIGKLSSFYPLVKDGPNLVDAAVASVIAGIEYETALPELGAINWASSITLADQTPVSKIGGITQRTDGLISAFELDNVAIDYGNGVTLQFHNQIEIDDTTAQPFSKSGDSGSLIVVTTTKETAGLLFASSETGNSRGTGRTYANHIADIISALNIGPPTNFVA